MFGAVVIALFVLQLLSFWFASFLLVRWVSRQRSELLQTLRAFVESTDSEPSPLAVWTDQFATLFAGRVWQQIEARLRGAAGTVTREANKEAETEMAASSPLAALAMAFLPKKVKSQLANNPQFLGGLAQLVSGKKGSRNDGAGAPSNMRMEM